MTSTFANQLRIGALSLLALSASQIGAAPAVLAQQPPPAAPAAPAPAAPAGPTAMANPSMAGPLVANPNPMHTDFGPDAFGTIYLTGAITGLALFQTDPFVGNHHATADLSNGQFIVQKTEGLLQFYAQGGVY